MQWWYSPLSYACYGGSYDIAKYFVEECGLDPESSNGQTWYPLHYAAMSDNFDAVEYLVEECKVHPNRGGKPVEYASNSRIETYLKQVVEEYLEEYGDD